MTAFTEELGCRLRELDTDGKWSRELRHWNAADGVRSKRQLVDWSVQSTIEPPGPTRPTEIVRARVEAVYKQLGHQALSYLTGLRRWDKLNDTVRSRIERSIVSDEFSSHAADRYREHFLKLAVEVPEFLAWTLLNEHAATRAEIKSFAQRDTEIWSVLTRIEEQLKADSAALGDLPKLLAQLNGPKSGAREELLSRVTECHRIQRLILDKPLLTLRLNAESGLIHFPPIHEGYINPDFRLLETSRSDEGEQLAQEGTWQEQAVRKGLGGFLAAYFRSTRATKLPLLVLGDPGSGKSLLSKILAAQLPPDEFAVARVELRRVRSSQEVGDQIDLELRRQTNNSYQLQDITDPTGRITRVIIMDGLDELLQLSAHEGLGRYLEWLAEFQQIEAELGRPVIAIATARTIVMDRIYVPKQSVVIKLEGFSRYQINAWIGNWNRVNTRHFARQRLAELSIETMDGHADLARQPLLLALLALYDAEKNSLRNAGNLNQAELYERIFRRYLERELEKKALPPRKSERSQLIEQRFRELSTIATGMLNRGRRFITRQEAEEEFEAKNIRREQGGPVLRVDDAVGQFFFLYRAQAQHRDTTFYEGYEFIHATFGEFLAARILVQQLALASEIVYAASAWDRTEARWHALSQLVPYFAQRPLIGEEQALLFLETIVNERVVDREAAALAIAEHVPMLMKHGLVASHRAEQGRLDRLAILTLNLVLVTLLLNRRSIRLAAFCEDDRDPLSEWPRLLALWKANLAADDWARVLGSLSLSPQGEATLFYGRDDPSSFYGVMFPDTKTHIGRLVLEGQLGRDPDLTGAASVWHLLGRSRGDDLADMDHADRQARASELTSIAAFRVLPLDVAHSLPGGMLEKMLQYLAAGSVSRDNLIAQLLGGLACWNSDLLLAVSTFVKDQDDLTNTSMSALLQLIIELDRRDLVSFARGLLQRIPETSRGYEPADVANLISLLRRHQLRGHLHPSIGIEYLSHYTLPWLSLDDLAWIFQHGGYNEAQLQILTDRIKEDPSHQHTLDKAQLVAEWLEEES